MTKEGVFALGFLVGTPTSKVYVPMAREEKIPVVGLFTGAQMLYAPLKRYVINVRFLLRRNAGAGRQTLGRKCAQNCSYLSGRRVWQGGA
jgi:hypothetical protein